MANPIRGIRSYTSIEGRFWSQVFDLIHLARNAPKDVNDRVTDVMTMGAEIEAVYERESAIPLIGASVLELGPGHGLGYMLYLAQKNEVVGVDLDVVPNGFELLAYWKMFRVNGPKRLVKTIGRRFLSRERAEREELRHRLGVDRLHVPRVLEMDAAYLRFPDASLDFVYSVNVFEHFSNPETVLQEVKRVLKPGGVLYTNLHLFTCDSGFHDLRIIGNRRDMIAYWAHLRPGHRHEVRASAYLNEIRLEQWRAIFSDALPRSRFEYERDDDLQDKLRTIKGGGELAAHTEEELLIRNIVNVWRKPRSGA